MDFTFFVRSLKVAAIDREVFHHLVESADSVVLNIAEGRGRAGLARPNHYEITLGSAGEAAAALDIVRRARRDARGFLSLHADIQGYSTFGVRMIDLVVEWIALWGSDASRRPKTLGYGPRC